MKFKPLGNTTLQMSAIGQGTMGVGGHFDRDHSSSREHVNALRLGIELGMTLIDTAEVYAAGHAEELVREATRGIRDRVVIATKVSPEHLRYRDVIQACKGSLNRLGSDYIDLYQVHWPNCAIPIEETMTAMCRLLDEGKIRAVGVSNFSLAQLREAQEAVDGVNIVANQVEYNLFDRSVERDLLPYCNENRLSLIAYSPLDQGFLAPRNAGAEVLNVLAERYGKTSAQIVVNWLVRQPGVVAIPKALKPDHVRQNAAALEFELTLEDTQAIDRAFAMRSVDVPTNRIKVVLDGAGNRKVYQAIEDAMENSLGFTPSPAELAEGMRKTKEAIKPVRVRQTTDTSGRYDYDLVEGRIRYWAWVIAHRGERPISALVRQ